MVKVDDRRVEHRVDRRRAVEEEVAARAELAPLGGVVPQQPVHAGAVEVRRVVAEHHERLVERLGRRLAVTDADDQRRVRRVANRLHGAQRVARVRKGAVRQGSRRAQNAPPPTRASARRRPTVGRRQRQRRRAGIPALAGSKGRHPAARAPARATARVSDASCRLRASQRARAVHQQRDPQGRQPNPQANASVSAVTAVDAVLSHPKLHLLRRRRLLVGRGVARVAEQRAQPRVERRRHAAARSYGTRSQIDTAGARCSSSSRSRSPCGATSPRNANADPSQP